MDYILPLAFIPNKFISVGYLIDTNRGLDFGDMEEEFIVFYDFILKLLLGDC